MLQTDPTQRLTLSEIMNHPWITKGFNSPPENYLPHREPLQLPLDREVIERMTGFDFGTPEYITSQLTNVIQSEDYQRAVRTAAKRNTAQTPEADKKRGMFDFYKRRNSISSREQLMASSSEEIQRGLDPVNAFSPLISVYFLVKEKRDREKLEENPGAIAVPQSPGEKPLKMPDLPVPPAAYTNTAAYEMAGENPTGGRSRPRARTHGEDEIADGLKRVDLSQPPGVATPALPPPPVEHAKKEGAAAGLLRRFSTRRYRSHDKDRAEPLPPTPSVAVSSPPESASVPKKSFSIRRTRDRGAESSSHLQANASNQSELLSPPSSANSATRKFKALGRSTSVNSADLRRRLSRRGRSSEDPGNPPPTSGSDRSDLSRQKTQSGNDAASDDYTESSRSMATHRTKSLGHARRESIQARRARREQAKEQNGVPEETDAELAQAQAEAEESRGPDAVKPVLLKGLFSVSTTSSKPLSLIQNELIRVLDQLGVTYSEIEGGFKCRHTPSIDLNKVVDSPASPPSGSHRRRISFGGFMGGDKDREEFRDHHNRAPNTPKSRSRPSAADRSYTNTDESDGSEDRDERRPRSRRAVAAGETTTQVQSDLGESMILVFEILIVKVPLFRLHGIQFKKVDGGTWQYKNMAQTILSELRL